MKQSMSFLKRGLAFVLALVLVVSGINLGALQAFAETPSVSEGEVVANNYDLSAAEKDLLSSGLLIGNTISYTAPADSNLVTVDTDKKEITVGSYEGWVATKATIKVGNEVKETVAVENGKATYTHGGNAFSVEVTYELYAAVDAATQKTLLAAPSYLKTGYDALNTIAKVAGNLLVYETANNALVDLANKDGFRSDDAKAAALALNEQYVANGGLLDLKVMANEYDAAASKTQYLLTNGAAMIEKAEETYHYIDLVVNDDIMTHSVLNELLTEEQVSALETFRNSMSTWLFVMESVNYGWADEELAPVKAELSDAEWAKLDTLVKALGTTNTLTVKEGKLLAASAAVKVNMSMYNVNVVVKMQTASGKADDKTLVDYGVASTTVVTLAAGATAADVKAAVEATGIITSATSAWAAYEAEHYQVSYGTLPESLESDVEYVITYVPKNYTVDCDWQDDLAVPYGYKMTLGQYNGTDKVYDYKVNGTYYPQGSVITVIGNVTVTRTEGTPRENSILMDHIDISKLTDAEIKVLNSPAVSAGKSVISIRYPSNEKVTLADGVLTAEKVLSDYPNAELYWIPTTAEIKTNGVVVNTYTLTNGTATIAETDYDQVVVTYTLSLDDQDVAAVKNLPYTLLSQANTQLGQMDKLLTKYATLESVSRGILNTLKGYAEGETLTAVLNVLNNCIESSGGAGDGMLKLYNSLTAYKALGTDAEKASYYYKHYEEISTQLNMLRDNLVIIAADTEFLDLVAKDFGTYADEILEIKNAGDSLNDIVLLKPNSAIDTSSTALDALVTVLFSGEIKQYPAETLKLTHTISKAHENSRTIIVELVNSVTGKKVSFPLVAKIGEMLNADAAWTAFNAKYAELGIVAADAPYYNDAANKAAFAELLATAVSANKTVTLTWTPTEYTVKVEGTDVTLSTNIVEDFYIVLPKHSVDGMAYIYYVDGVKVAQGESVKVDLNNLPKISREEYNIAEAAANEKFDTFIANLNAESKGIIAVTASADRKTVTVAINASATQGELVGDAQSFVMGLIKQVYEQIYLDGDTLVNTDMKVLLQTVVNAVLNDRSFNNDNVANAILNGTPVLSATMDLCDKAGNVEKSVELKVVISNPTEQIRKIAKALKDIKPYVAFQSNYGVLDVEVNLPEKVYEVYLAALLVVNEVDLDDSSAINTEVATMFLYDYLNYVVSNDKIDTQTFMNSLAMVGQDIDLSVYEERYQQFRTIWNDWTEVESKGDYVQADVWAPMNTLVSNILSGEQIENYAGMLNAIYEYQNNSGIWARANITLGNTATKFEAIVIDMDAIVAGAKDIYNNGADRGTAVDMAKGNGIANGVDCTADLIERMSGVTGEAAIYLLTDIVGDLVINGTTVLDLNGHTINGNIVANGTLIIVDSTLSAAHSGTVTGTVSGNVAIVAGNYPNQDVSAFLRDGYKQVNGHVQNALYYFDGVNGELTLVINSDVMYDGSVDGYLPSVKYLAADVAIDLALNFYIPGSISANGHELVGIDDNFHDLLGLWDSKTTLGDVADATLACLKASGISSFANEVIADLLDFGAIADALENETEVVTYTLGTNGWAINLEYIENGNYLTFGIVEDEADSKSVELSLVIEGNNIKKLIALLRELDAIIVKAEASVNLDQPVRDGKTLYVGGSTSGLLAIDISEDNVAIDHADEYKTILAVALAYGNPDKADALVATIGDDEAFKAMFDEITVQEVINAMEAMNKATSFEAMCDAVDAELNEKAADLESLYHLIVVAAGEAIEKVANLEIPSEVDVPETSNDYVNKAADILERAYQIVARYANKVLDTLKGIDQNAKLGSLEEEYGVYVLSGSYTIDGAKSFRGYTADYELSVEKLTLAVKIFVTAEDPVDPDDPTPDNPTPPDGPQTGDDFNSVLYITILVISPLMIVALVVIGDKKRFFK